MLENHYYVKNYNYNKSFTYKNIISFYISRSVSQIFNFFFLHPQMSYIVTKNCIDKGERKFFL